MNIRGTDPAALTAVTDLFVAPPAARDDRAPDFQRALSPPPKPSEPAPTPVSKRDEPARQTQAKKPDAPERSQPADQQCERDEAEAPAAPVAEETKDQPVAEAEDTAVEIDGEAPAAQETAENSDATAAALAVATTIVVDQPLPEQKIPQVNPELMVEAGAAVEEVAVEGEPAKAEIAVCTAHEVAAGAAEELPLVQEVSVATDDATKATVETTLDSALQQSPDVAAAESIEPTSGIGQLPSTLQTQVTSGNTKSISSRTAPSRATAEERVKGIKNAPDRTTTTASPEATPVESAGTTVVPPALNSDDKPERKSNRPDQIVQPIAELAIQQPSEPATLEIKVDSAAAPPSEAPVVSELHSTQQASPDPTKLTSTQPLANQAITNRLPAHAVMRTTPQQPAPPPLHVDAARFLQRVAKAFESAHERGGEIRLRLSPPELGALRVEVNMSEQGLAARVEVETNDARTVLLENLSALRDRLADQGLRLEKFDVDLSQREPSQRDSHQFPEQPQDRDQPREARRTNIATKQSSPTQANSSSPPTSGWQDRQLNVIV